MNRPLFLSDQFCLPCTIILYIDPTPVILMESDLYREHAHMLAISPLGLSITVKPLLSCTLII